MGGRRTPSSAPRRGRASAVTSPVDAANVRKSNRPAKPRSLDLLPSGACHLAPGLAAVGRRLKVHWPDEMQWFAGHVAHFDEASGKHHIVYDDGDSEELVLAAERFEWIQTPAVAVNLASPRAAAAEAFLDPLDTSPYQGRLSGRKAAPGAEDGAWPCVGDFLWGRVKGHGWWPGRVVYPIAEKPSATAVCVEFFDNTSGWVLRNECLPFEEHFDAMHRSKRLAAFAKATRLAWNAWAQEHSPHSDMKRRPGASFAGRFPSAKRARTQEADPAAGGLFVGGGGDHHADAPMHLGAAGRPRRATSRRSGSGRRPSAKPRRAPPRGFGAAVGVLVVGGKAADVSDLARRLGDLKSRLSPIAAQAHERVATQLRTLLQPDARRVISAAPGSWAAQERLRLLSQLEALERLPRLAVAIKRSSALSVAVTENLPEPPAAHDVTHPPPELDEVAAGCEMPADAPAGEEHALGVEPLQFLQEEVLDGNATEESDG